MTPSSPKPPKPSSRRPCASSETVPIRLAGLDLVPDLSGAAYVPDYATLLVADLHLEKGSAAAARARGLLPPYDTRTTLMLLAAAVDRFRPRRLIALGDSFHDGGGPDRMDRGDAAFLDGLAERTEIVWIAGNHDPALPRVLPGRRVLELALGPLALRHEPRPGAAPEIAGHLHPVAALVRRGRRLRCRCFVAGPDRLVMPAFGAYTGGLDVSAAPFRPLFPDDRFGVWMLGSRRIHLVPGRAVIGRSARAEA